MTASSQGHLTSSGGQGNSLEEGTFSQELKID